MSLDAVWSGLGVAPEVVSASAISERRVRLFFDSLMRHDAALVTPANYTITPDMGSDPRTVVSVAAAPADVDPTYVDLELDGILTNGTDNYEVEVNDAVADTVGNGLDPAHDTATFSGQHTAPEIESHCEDGKARLAAQFENSTRLRALVCAFGDQMQALEQAGSDILAFRSLTTAVGAQLDGLGENMGLRRGGKTDTEYRLRLQAQALVISSNGAADRMLEILDKLDDGTSSAIALREDFPACVVMTFEVPEGGSSLGLEFLRFLAAAKPAGVKLNLEFFEQDVPIFSWDGGTTPLPGGWFGSSTPGRWAEAVGTGRVRA